MASVVDTFSERSCADCGDGNTFRKGTPESGYYINEYRVKGGGSMYFCDDCAIVSSRVVRVFAKGDKVSVPYLGGDKEVVRQKKDGFVTIEVVVGDEPVWVDAPVAKVLRREP